MKITIYILVLLSVLFLPFMLFSQTEEAEINLIDFFETDSISNDTVRVEPVVSKVKQAAPLIESPISYTAKDSMAFSLENGQQIVHLYGDATIKYGTINLEADYISMNFENKEIFATVVKDSLGNIQKKSKFTEGGEEFECESLRYNFKTGKGFVENVVTAQQDGLVRGAKAKMMNKDVYCMVDGKYSTCDADHPHFYLQMTKGKIVREKAIITGRAYLVLEDFPIYVPFLPYGYIPTNKKTYSSGVIIPSYGQERSLGFYLRDGGFYWAASDYFDLRVTGDIYSNGKWAVNASTKYRWRYKFSGNFGFSYAHHITGERGINQKVSPSFSVRWSLNQDSKASLSQTFNVSVDFKTSGFSKENEFNNPEQFLNNSTSSSVTYRKDFLNTPFNVSASMRLSQNSRDSTISLSLPSLNINMKSIYPFKNKKRVGKKGVFDDFKLSYSAQFDSKITTKESQILSTPYADWDKGLRHNLPITFPSFRLFNYINVVPSIGYNESWAFDYTEKYWIDGYYGIDNETGMEKWMSGHVEEKQKDGFKRNYNFNVSLGASTTLYGLYNMKNPNWKVKSIRHKIDPSFGFSYNPDFTREWFGFYEMVQVDSLGNMQRYNIFNSSASTASGSIRFGVNNNIEMKIVNDKDTTSNKAFKKVPIFDNLSFSSSYNLFADSLNLAPFSLNARVKIAGTAINLTGTLDPYALNEKGIRMNEFMWNNANGIARLGRLTNLSTGYSYSYSSDKFTKMKEERKKKNHLAGDETDTDDVVSEDENLKYSPFNMPWRVSLNYTVNYSNPNGKARWTQSVNLNGSLDITPKWKTTFSSGFDFIAMEITHTKMSVIRDLHCWSMSFDFAPISTRPYYTFTIRANASMLQDLKVNKSNTDYAY